MMPAPPKICWKTVTTSTHEKKWGRYMIAWATARTRGLITLLMTSASRIGMGKKSTSWRKNSTKVFCTACQKPESWKIRSNCSKPTQGLSNMATKPLSLRYGS